MKIEQDYNYKTIAYKIVVEWSDTNQRLEDRLGIMNKEQINGK